jgi:hypothetical protein
MAMPSTSFLIASPTALSVAPSASPAEPMPLKLRLPVTPRSASAFFISAPPSNVRRT